MVIKAWLAALVATFALMLPTAAPAYNQDPGGGQASYICYSYLVGWGIWAQFNWWPGNSGLWVCGGDGYWHYYGWQPGVYSNAWSNQLVSSGY